MKIITEERLKEISNNLLKAIMTEEHEIVEILLHDHMQELDTLIVSKLRPMCDALVCNDPMAAYHIKEKRMLQIEFDCLTGKWDTLIGQCEDSEFSGFELMPTYKPELAGDGE